MFSEIPSPTQEIAPPRHIGGEVLFVDADGVLHPSSVYYKRGAGPFLSDMPGHTLFEHAQLLEDELAPYPSVRIVFSTSWIVRYRGSIDRVASQLTPGLQSRIIGATYHSRMHIESFVTSPRGMQVWSDVQRRHPSAWLALDDDDVGWPAWCRDQLIKTDGTYGISSPAVLEELRAKFAHTFSTVQ
jgi:hypothetical protein